MEADEGTTVTRLPIRSMPIPKHLSATAAAYLKPQAAEDSYPSVDDKAGWRRYVAAAETAVKPLLDMIGRQAAAEVDEQVVGGVRVYKITPGHLNAGSDGIVLDLHGGGLILCGGELCAAMGRGLASRLRRVVWSVDYRMPPDHPFPAALDDCLAVYRALLEERPPGQVIISGGSAGGNLAAALVLRARDEGLPLPAGVVLATPEVDLTESGDSFQTNLGVDPTLRSLMPVNLLYADGHDLRHPYLSPLFGDFSGGFPPTILTTGTRDLYLSNTVRMHRALRDCGVAAELHVLEAAAHTGFPGSPEGESVDEEIRRFIKRVLQPASVRRALSKQTSRRLGIGA